MKKRSLIVLIVMICITFCSCGGNNTKELLCKNMYYSISKKQDTLMAYYGIESTTFSLLVFEFKPNNTFVEYSELDTLLGGNSNETNEGKYKINEKTCQIELTYTKGIYKGDTQSIPYYINEYDHSLIFCSKSNGNSDFETVNNTQEAINKYNIFVDRYKEWD